jgi:NAD/NADP transhydrogenase beta subunit
MHWQTYFIEFSYLLASILFILGLKGLSHPETAKRGMHLAEFGMLMAIIGTLMHFEIITYTWIITGLVVGSLVGLAMGLWVPMTAMPQRTALSHAFGAFAAALLFGASTALSFRLAQPWGNASVLFQALPYVLTLIAVAGVIGRSVPPAAAGRPYVKQ